MIIASFSLKNKQASWYMHMMKVNNHLEVKHMSNGVHAACSVFELFLAVLVGVGLILLSAFGVVAEILAFLGGLAITLNTIVGVIGVIVVILFAYCIIRRLWRCCFGGRC
jgi:hypothetical protein